MYVCMYVCMYVYECMYVCTCMYVCMYVCMYDIVLYVCRWLLRDEHLIKDCSTELKSFESRCPISFAIHLSLGYVSCKINVMQSKMR